MTGGVRCPCYSPPDPSLANSSVYSEGAAWSRLVTFQAGQLSVTSHHYLNTNNVASHSSLLRSLITTEIKPTIQYTLDITSQIVIVSVKCNNVES